MAKNDFTNNSEAVAEYIRQLEIPFAALVENVRQVILSADKSIGEHIKWNSPAFFYGGEMKEFAGKEYKRDLVVMNLRKGNVLLIFPTGDRIKDDSGILEGDFSDGRRMITINTSEELESKRDQLVIVVKNWLSTVE